MLTRIALALLLLLPMVAQERRMFRVRIDVNANEPLKTQVTSWTSGELRRLGDVTVTDSEPDFVFRMSVLFRKDLQSRDYALSYYITAPMTDADVESFGATKVSEGTRKFLKKFELLVDNGLTVGSRIDYLRDDIDQIISGFDVRVLKSDREIRQQK
jgi:hypothetical protein